MNAIVILTRSPVLFFFSITALLAILCLKWAMCVNAGSPSVSTNLSFRIPPLPSGVTDLKFSDFFVSPVGPVGLEYTAKLQRLRGKRVRVLGYMVQQENKNPGTFLLSAIPVQLHDNHYGLGDDLPAATLFVFDPANSGMAIPHVPGLVLLSGTLELGNREEADGRISLVRLTLEAPPKSQKRRSSGKGSTDLLRSASKIRSKTLQFN